MQSLFIIKVFSAFPKVLQVALYKFWATSSDSPDNIAYAFVLTDAVAFGSARFGIGIGTIFLDNVGCTGSEANLIDCSRSSTVSCYYGHSEDAGVRCQGLKK